MKSKINNKIAGRNSLLTVIAFSLLFFTLTTNTAKCERIKDIVDIHGLRGNPLSGISLVVGLSNTGDTSILSRQMLTNILRESGLVVDPEELTGSNIAVVMVTAELGPFDREGSRIDPSLRSSSTWLKRLSKMRSRM